MDRVKSHFQDEARVFDGLIIHVIPYYRQMIEALISAIPHDRDAPLRAIDLGCGTATIAKMILERFPRSSVTCLDFSENMLKVARAKLDGFENVRFVFSDFNSHEFDQEYDVAVSSLALHHLVACKDKRQYYARSSIVCGREACSSTPMWYWRQAIICRMFTCTAGASTCCARFRSTRSSTNG